MIDLRSDRERKNDDNSAQFRQLFKPSQSRTQAEERILYQMHLTGWGFIANLLLDAPFNISMKALGCYFTGDAESSTLLLVGHLHSRGLLSLYLTFLEHSQAEICAVLDRCVDALSAGPTLVFCTLGKDRTGLICALVLSAVGADRADICTDYAQSKQIQLTAHYRALIEKTGLQGEFLEAPVEVALARFPVGSPS